MTPRADVVALVLGLLLALLAGLGLWAAFGTVDWGLVRVALPVCLVAVGVLGLLVSRPAKT